MYLYTIDLKRDSLTTVNARAKKEGNVMEEEEVKTREEKYKENLLSSSFFLEISHFGLSYYRSKIILMSIQNFHYSRLEHLQYVRAFCTIHV